MTVTDHGKAGPSWFNDQAKSSLGNMSTIIREKKIIDYLYKIGFSGNNLEDILRIQRGQIIAECV